jgi:protein associated with RNAse G/E
MERDFLVESRSYDHLMRGSWRAYKVDRRISLSVESSLNHSGADDCTCVWLPRGTLMNWASGTRPLPRNCVQFFWPQRWFMFSAFYHDAELLHTYVNIIQPATMQLDRVSYVDLDLSMLLKPDLSYEVLTQAEFEHASHVLHYNEETRIGALMALHTLTSSIQRSTGLFSVIPYHLDLTRLHAVTSIKQHS